MNTKEIEKKLIEYINFQGGVLTSLGELEFTNKDRVGQGCNGVVYIAKINDKEIAIKFLISDSERKKLGLNQNTLIPIMLETSCVILLI